MSLHIIVDGYNLIRQSKQLRILDLRDIQEGRESLQDILTAYRKNKGHRITIVFDGTSAVSTDSRRRRINGIEIIFSRIGETADSVIKGMAAREKERALIVSSDREIISFAASVGSATIGSQAFEDKILETLSFGEHSGMGEPPETGWIPTTRKKGPRRRLPKNKRRNQGKVHKL